MEIYIGGIVIAIIGFGVICYRYLQYGKHLNYKNYHIVRISHDKYAIRRDLFLKNILSRKIDGYYQDGYLGIVKSFIVH